MSKPQRDGMPEKLLMMGDETGLEMDLVMIDLAVIDLAVMDLEQEP
jgi:hypothetical protein